MNRSPLTALHSAAGARLSAGDAPELLTYGDVPGEYRAALEACVLFDATARGRVVVAGADAATFLHRLLANDVRNQPVGTLRHNLLLSSKGKVLYEFDLWREEARIELALPSARAKALIAAIDMYLFSEKVVLSDESERCAPLELLGPARFDVARVACGVEAPREDGQTLRASFRGTELRIASRPSAGSAALELDAGPEHVVELWKALLAAGARASGVIVRDILRVEAGATLFGVDVDENVYPQEARLERAFSLDKGCYIGQEVVAKIDTYGGLNKRLVALKVSHDDPVARGTRLWRLDAGEWRDLGVVTSWAYSFVLDTGLVLAYVKRRHQKAGTEFRLGDGPATATIVPLPVRGGALAPSGEFE